MKYKEFLSTFSQEEFCPFCHFDDKDIVFESRSFYVVLARAPYCIDHFLIIPRRHVVFLHELDEEEKNELWGLTEEWNSKVRQYHQGASILLRDVPTKMGLKRSINHLHLHIIPDCPVGVEKSDQRIFLSDEEYTKTVQELKQKYLN